MDTIPVGAYLALSSGAYSDYSVCGFFQTVRALSPAVLEAYLDAYPAQRERYRFQDKGWTAWLVAEGYVVALPYYELHWDGSVGSTTQWTLEHSEHPRAPWDGLCCVVCNQRPAVAQRHAPLSGTLQVVCAPCLTGGA